MIQGTPVITVRIHRLRHIRQAKAPISRGLFVSGSCKELHAKARPLQDCPTSPSSGVLPTEHNPLRIQTSLAASARPLIIHSTRGVDDYQRHDTDKQREHGKAPHHMQVRQCVIPRSSNPQECGK